MVKKKQSSHAHYIAIVAIVAVVAVVILVMNSMGTLKSSDEAIAGQGFFFGQKQPIDPTFVDGAKDIAGNKEEEGFSSRYQKAVAKKSTTKIPVLIKKDLVNLHCVDENKISYATGINAHIKNPLFKGIQLNCLYGESDVAGYQMAIDSFYVDEEPQVVALNSYVDSVECPNGELVEGLLVSKIWSPQHKEEYINFVLPICQDSGLGDVLKSKGGTGSINVLSCEEGKVINGLTVEIGDGAIKDITKVFCLSNEEIIYEAAPGYEEPEEQQMEYVEAVSYEETIPDDIDLSYVHLWAFAKDYGDGNTESRYKFSDQVPINNWVECSSGYDVGPKVSWGEIYQHSCLVSVSNNYFDNADDGAIFSAKSGSIISMSSPGGIYGPGLGHDKYDWCTTYRKPSGCSGLAVPGLAPISCHFYSQIPYGKCTSFPCSKVVPRSAYICDNYWKECTSLTNGKVVLVDSPDGYQMTFQCKLELDGKSFDWKQI